MITQRAIDNLYRIASNFSYRDFMAVNKNRKSKRVKPYSLSDETKEAVDLLGIAYKSDVSREEEELVKGYILKIRFTQPDMLENTNPNYEQWHNAKIERN